MSCNWLKVTNSLLHDNPSRLSLVTQSIAIIIHPGQYSRQDTKHPHELCGLSVWQNKQDTKKISVQTQSELGSASAILGTSFKGQSRVHNCLHARSRTFRMKWFPPCEQYMSFHKGITSRTSMCRTCRTSMKSTKHPRECLIMFSLDHECLVFL